MRWECRRLSVAAFIGRSLRGSPRRRARRPSRVVPLARDGRGIEKSDWLAPPLAPRRVIGVVSGPRHGEGAIRPCANTRPTADHAAGGGAAGGVRGPVGQSAHEECPRRRRGGRRRCGRRRRRRTRGRRRRARSRRRSCRRRCHPPTAAAGRPASSAARLEWCLSRHSGRPPSPPPRRRRPPRPCQRHWPQRPRGQPTRGRPAGRTSDGGSHAWVRLPHLPVIVLFLRLLSRGVARRRADRPLRAR